MIHPADRPLSTPPSIRRVLGGGPFAEIGKPTVAVPDEAHGLVAVGGSVGNLSWPGRYVDGWHGHRVGVHGLDDLGCRLLVRSRWPVLDLAFHPHLPLLAVGTGAYDGGWFYEGELLLVDLESGATVSALEYPREVRRVDWREDGRALRLALAPHDDEDDESPETHGFAVTVERDDWRAVADRTVLSTEQVGPRVEAPHRPDGVKEAARELLTALAAEQGIAWHPRRRVWAVEELSDGRVLAALEGVKLESRLPSGELEWSVPDPDGGCELSVAPDQRSAWVNLARTARWIPGSGWVDAPGAVERLSLADGATLAVAEVAHPVTLTAATDGRIALRDTRNDRPKTPTVLLAPERPQSAGPVLGGYDARNNWFGVRRSPELLFLQGKKKKYWKDKWVVAVDPEGDGRGEVRRLFPLAWDTDRAGHLFGGPAVRLDGALVHAGQVHHGSGLQPGHAFIVRRRFPDGLPQWVFTGDHLVTALDTDGTTVFAALTSGEILALDAADGTQRWRTRLTVDGIPTVALSLTVPGPGRLLLGTVDGRILLT
ncbi:hypothetical protein [Kitasatospora sp. NPDC093806]|uniref:hypothetical protein n=1 Tax=Kitasatospora sp. NPDC093806 TaxID=3155075 RepID=UPI00341E7C73